MTQSKYVFKSFWKRALASIFDAVGSLFFRANTACVNLTELKRVLVLRLDHLGDLLLNWPALEALRESVPGAQIDIVISADHASLFDGIAGFNVIAVTDHWFSRKSGFLKVAATWLSLVRKIKAGYYDLALDFRGDLRHILLMTFAGIPLRFGFGITGGGFLLTRRISYDFSEHQTLANFRLLNALGVPRSFEPHPIAYSESKKHEVWKKFEDFLADRSRKKVLIHMGAGYPSKRWPVENYFSLMRKIRDQGNCHMILIGSKSEKSEMPLPPEFLGQVTDLRARTTLSELALLMAECDCFIGNDSGPAHLAALEGLSGCVLFSGTNDAKIWRPWFAKLEVRSYPVPCSPCEARECPLGHHDCMKKITVGAVYQSIVSMLCDSESHQSQEEGSQILRPALDETQNGGRR